MSHWGCGLWPFGCVRATERIICPIGLRLALGIGLGVGTGRVRLRVRDRASVRCSVVAGRVRVRVSTCIIYPIVPKELDCASAIVKAGIHRENPDCHRRCGHLACRGKVSTMPSQVSLAPVDLECRNDFPLERW